MDVVLRIADDYVLDKAWAWALPAVPRSLSSVDASLLSYATASTSQKVASSSASTIYNLTAHLANALGSRSGSAEAVNSAREGLSSHIMSSTAELEALQGASAWGRDYIWR